MRSFLYSIVILFLFPLAVIAEESKSELPPLPTLPAIPNTNEQLKQESLPEVSLPKDSNTSTPSSPALPPVPAAPDISELSTPDSSTNELPTPALPTNKPAVQSSPALPTKDADKSIPLPTTIPAPKTDKTVTSTLAAPFPSTPTVSKPDEAIKATAANPNTAFDDKFKVFEQSSTPDAKALIEQVEQEANKNITSLEKNPAATGNSVIVPSKFNEPLNVKIAVTGDKQNTSNKNLKTTDPEKSIVVPPKSVAKSSTEADLQTDLLDAYIEERPIYDYNNQQSSSLIYKKRYGPNNSHLPKSFDMSEYSQYLFVATYRDDVGTMNALLDKGADINAKDKNGYTPLMYSIIYDKQKAYRSLISKGADLNIGNDNKLTALHLAAQKKNLPAISELIDNGANNFALDGYGYPPFYYADNIRDEYALIVLNNADDVNLGFIEVVKMGSIPAASKALTLGADIDYQNAEGDTALLTAAFNNDLPMVNFLLAKGAYPEIANLCLIKPMDAALANRNQQMADAIDTILIKNELEGNYPTCLAVEAKKKSIPKPKRTKLVHASKSASRAAAIINKAQNKIDLINPPMDCDINSNTIYRKAN